jgi:hypothetical protein
VKIGARPSGVIEDEIDASCDNPEHLKVPEVNHETDVEKWFNDRPYRLVRERVTCPPTPG